MYVGRTKYAASTKPRKNLAANSPPNEWQAAVAVEMTPHTAICVRISTDHVIH